MAHEECKRRKRDRAAGAAWVVVLVIIALLVVKMSKPARSDVATSYDFCRPHGVLLA
jgi:hypothetical protein